MNEFAYHRPSDLAEATELLGRDGARALAGGSDIIPEVREGRRRVSSLVDLKGIEETTAIRLTSDGHLAIGAAAPAYKISASPLVLERLPALADSVRLIGSRQIQSRASLGGNIANAAPSADAVPIVLCAGSSVEINGPRGRRRLPLAELFEGPRRTRLSPGELIVSVLVPPQPARSAGAYLRFTPRREMDIAVVGAAARVALGADGRITSAAIALASVAPTPLLVPEAARILEGQRPTAEVVRAAGSKAASLARPISDTRGSAGYRRRLVETLTTRALARSLSSLGIEIEVP